MGILISNSKMGEKTRNNGDLSPVASLRLAGKWHTDATGLQMSIDLQLTGTVAPVTTKVFSL